MTELKGIVVTAPLVTPGTDNQYPTHYDYFGFGGCRSVADIDRRDAIPALRRSAGMLVSVISTETVYMLLGDLVSWEAVAEVSRDGSSVVMVTVPFNFISAAVFTLPSGKSVTSVAATVTQPWNGSGYAVVVGTSNGGTDILSQTEIELDTPATYQSEVFGVQGPSTLYVTNTVGTGTSTGSLTLRISIS